MFFELISKINRLIFYIFVSRLENLTGSQSISVMYNWELNDWPDFIYNEHVIDEWVLKFSELTGRISGIFGILDSVRQQREMMNLMISEAQKTSAIEGELLSREDLMSSIRNHLALNVKLKNIKDKRAENIVLLMLEVRKNYHEKLSEKMLKNWHQMLFKGSKYINAGVYRKGEEPMQIVSGRYGNEKVHYEAPPSSRIPMEMKQFVKWYNAFKTNGNIQNAVIKAAIAHLYFESIHPFEDGNGRIGRALIEKCLAESLNRQVILSISTVIEKNKKRYYTELNRASKTLEIDNWIVYFVQLLFDAQKNAIEVIHLSIKRTRFFDTCKDLLNARQTKVLKKMLGTEDFEGGMTAKKYISITRTTKATATRDLQELVSHTILVRKGDGRSTHYVLNKLEV